MTNMDCIIDETQLRQKACDWLTKKFQTREYLINPIVFHDIGLTLSQYLLKKFKGKQLTDIPNYNALHIRPDVIALIISRKDNNRQLLWTMGECKVGKISVRDFRQARFYFEVSNTYEGFVFYAGVLSEEVRRLVLRGFDVYNGTNKWGQITKKRMIFVEYVDNVFKKKRFS